MTGASHIYRRLLDGRVTPERYCAVVKRAVDMGVAVSRKQREVVQELEGGSK